MSRIETIGVKLIVLTNSTSKTPLGAISRRRFASNRSRELFADNASLQIAPESFSPTTLRFKSLPGGSFYGISKKSVKAWGENRKCSIRPVRNRRAQSLLVDAEVNIR
jgi:hypothetical protein